jgi:broad specificity phosphatase PhoE
VRLYFTRHGESEANVQQIFWNGIEGYGLTEKGQAQAGQLANHLAGIDFAALYCSPVLRARQTAQIISRRLGIPCEIADGLREYDVGILEGQPYNEATHAIYWAATVEWLENENDDTRIEGGESLNDIRARFMPFIRGLERAHAGTDANVLCVGHGGTYRSMLPLLLSNVDRRSPLAQHIGYTMPIVAERRGSQWVCLQWGEETLADPIT